MLNKAIKVFEITLGGAILFASAPFVAYAATTYVYTGNAVNVTATNATLNGFVNFVDGGNTQTKAWFEYGTDPNFSNAMLTNAHDFYSGYSGNYNYSSNISGLYQNANYYFRAVAQNSQGRIYGNLYAFKTSFLNNLSDDANYYSSNYYSSLSIVTEPATFVSSKEVQLNAFIYNETNSSSNTWFEWGTTTNFGNKTTPIQTGTFPTIKHADILTGLSPGTTYYFRAMAENSSRRSEGAILSFVTSGGTSVASTISTKETSSNTSATQSVKSVLGANAFGAGSFFPTNIFGWLILSVLILILLLLSKYLYGMLYLGNEKNYRQNKTISH